MDHPLLVCIFESVGCLHNDARRLLLWERPLVCFNQSTQVHSWNVFRHQVMGGPVLPSIVSSNEVGAIELGLKSNLTSEAVKCLRSHSTKRKRLYRHLSAHYLVDCLKDVPHPPLPNKIGDDIGS